MPLKPLQADPEPTEADLARYLIDDEVLRVRAECRRIFARFKWRVELKAVSPDLFLKRY